MTTKGSCNHKNKKSLISEGFPREYRLWDDLSYPGSLTQKEKLTFGRTNFRLNLVIFKYALHLLSKIGYFETFMDFQN